MFQSSPVSYNYYSAPTVTYGGTLTAGGGLSQGYSGYSGLNFGGAGFGGNVGLGGSAGLGGNYISNGAGYYSYPGGGFPGGGFPSGGFPSGGFPGSAVGYSVGANPYGNGTVARVAPSGPVAPQAPTAVPSSAQPSSSPERVEKLLEMSFTKLESLGTQLRQFAAELDDLRAEVVTANNICDSELRSQLHEANEEITKLRNQLSASAQRKAGGV